MKKSFFYRVMALSIGALLAGIIACKNPASPDPVNPEQNVQTPSDNGSGGGGGGGSGGGGIAPPVNQKADQEKVDAAKAVLELRVNGKVSWWINLPSRGAYGTSISWTSSPSGIINTNAPRLGSVVTQPEEDTEVTLTATITKGSATATKTFTVTVYGKNQELVDRAVQHMSQKPPAFVMGSGTPPETMHLQKTSHIGSDQVDFEWKAQPEGSVTFTEDAYNIIGTVIQPEASAEKKTVTLTATARKGNSTASITFTVTVYPKNQTPSLGELLTQIMDTVPAATDKDIPLISTVASGYHLAWATPNNSVLEISGNYAKIITRDLVNRKATLTAKLSKEISPPETAQKEKVVTVKAQTKFDNCELTGDLLTMRDEGIVSAVYRVQINADAKTITAALEKAIYHDTLMTLDAIQRQQLAEIDSINQAYRSMLLLCDKETVTLQDIKEAVIQMNPGTTTMSDEEAFEWITDEKESYDDFKDKNAEEKSQFLKPFLNKLKTEMYQYLSLSPDAPLEQALAQMKEQQIEWISAHIENAKKQHIYTYRVENYNNRLDTEAPYVSGAPWYRQERGSYSFWDNSDNIKSVRIYGRLQNDGKYKVSIEIGKKGSKRDDWFNFSASGYDGSGAITAKTRDGKQITVTVTEKDPRKVEVVCDGDISFTKKELTFRGYPIPESPFWK